MLSPLVLGLVFGGGLVLCLLGLLRPQPVLVDALRSLDHAPADQVRRKPAITGLVVRMAGAVGVDVGTLERDLRVTARTFEEHALAKALAGGFFFALPVGFGALLTMGGIGVPWGLVVTASLVAGAAGYLVPDLTIRSEAERRRREFRHALAAYLDLVVIVVAGGGGTESALHDAADAGSGWPFSAIRRALGTAQLRGATPWDALRDLGDDLGVTELVELAAGVSLAGEQGARVRASLTAKATSMREQQLTEAEAQAQAATERMSVPVVLLLFGFLAFILYPALQFVLEGL